MNSLPDIEQSGQGLSNLRFDPAATRSYELLSGGLVWSDEVPRLESDGNLGPIYLLRFLVAYRASVIRGNPDQRLESIWRGFQSVCPHWPGFRPERSDPALREALDKHADEFIRTMDVCERAERIKAIRDERRRKRRRWWQLFGR